ncbi:MAG: glycine cleavage system aminomethyltransferase GcvT [Calditrichaeota bacterium]|nr:MAG: glycine cleavage system aminomethyltransferase GcvT [Calditrichota bacterium]MBL1207704.1 glycine cleavage system aminomethyltransferase GcvT [Calditrichota bacterium]NOG47539.1 glycine cleavage system aminomethyltransferase GcvT [Calditrichota bacterium]
MKKTALYDKHISYGAKMVEFAGFSMPIQYKGIRDEHRKVRESVGVFDVSHMGEIEVSGENALAMIERLTVNNVAGLEIGQAHYTAMCYEDGGIVDDLLVYRYEDKFLLVVNAANKEKDLAWILKNKLDGCVVTDTSEQITQLAVQGQKAEETLQQLTKVDLSAIKFYWFEEGVLADAPMLISRTGYTGEPGFELYFENQYALQVWDAVFEAGKKFDIEPIGLAARDSLRLEKKMCLYGNDIDQTTNPLEAGLGWITKLDKGDFIGSDVLRKVKEDGLNRRLVAFVLNAPGFPRKGYKIFKDGEELGVVTSGTVSPMLEKGIGLGYVKKGFTKIGTEIEIEVRNKMVKAEIIKPPFV